MHVVVGAGTVGSLLALELAGQGHRVCLVSRSGSGPEHPLVMRAVADAGDARAMATLARDAQVIYNCANPPYTRWPMDWPPIAASLLRTAEESGAVLVTLGNLYSYGEPDAPMREGDALRATGRKGMVRARMWEDAKMAHNAGLVRATEARASDYFGPGLTFSSTLGRAMPAILQGKRVTVIGSPDRLHSWTYVPDVVRTLVALGKSERAWGRPWHVPTNPPLTQRALFQWAAEIAGAPPVRIQGLSHTALALAGVFVPLLRETAEVSYQFERDFILDSSAAQDELSLAPTPMQDALAATVASWRRR